MNKVEALSLSKEEESLLVEVLLEQSYAIEVVCSQISDVEKGNKSVDEAKIKKLNALYDRLVKAGV
ncbi:antirepressor AbbA [Bacillus solimangrovi]|uniref:Antirepressor AbbA n=1 Tax=Bacillus solimangrovi TaxID=1305675 RepID=A0A1E5LJH8_9BACI|nr:antirepressor AbbA [Bacillus solimangrovi]OEH94247.1 hypothetical protein BFG57_09365 [Bacillus solimangrovi]